MEDEHLEFWENLEDSIQRYSRHYEQDPYIKFEYVYVRSSNSSRLKSIEFGNPSPQDGLHLSKLKFINNSMNTRITAYDIEDNKILDIKSEDDGEERLHHSNPNYIRKRIVETLYSKLSQDLDDNPFFMYENLESKDNNVEYLQINSQSNKISDFQKLREELSQDEEIEKTEEIADGLISRLISTAAYHGRKIGEIQQFLNSITHVGPLRNSPRRIYFGAGGSPGLQAESGNQVEKRIFSSENSQDEELINKTNNWLSETGFDCQLDVSDVGVGDLYQLEVKQSGLSINLADAGFGLSQTIPIIIECINMQLSDEPSSSSFERGLRPVMPGGSQAPLGVIEQPEIHLNPRIEAALGDFFIDVMESGSNLIIETHSEHLLNRLQRRVVDGSIEEENNVVIYFISKEEKESELREIEISSSGELSQWPDGFFQDDFEDAMEILKESF